MKCLICGKNSEKSCCDDCSNKKRCKECNILKTDFYKYKNNKIYSTCIECFNGKVKCEFCNNEFIRTYLSKHIGRCHIKTNHLNNEDENSIINNSSEIDTESTGGVLRASRVINNNDQNHNHENNDENIYKTLIVGPSFCGKTHLLLNKLQLIRLCDSEKQIKNN